MIPTKRTDPVMRMKATVPPHVVYRNLVSETVVLDLKAGVYYGLNSTAGRMLEALERDG
jgi:hypothetical protein